MTREPITIQEAGENLTLAIHELREAFVIAVEALLQDPAFQDALERIQELVEEVPAEPPPPPFKPGKFTFPNHPVIPRKPAFFRRQHHG